MNTPEDNRKQNTTIENNKPYEGVRKKNKKKAKEKKIRPHRRHKKTEKNKGRRRS